MAHLDQEKQDSDLERGKSKNMTVMSNCRFCVKALQHMW
ncbi:hypothetical protein ERO13_A06G086650v2 [Gossypium hirsutum]|nr:hypothetical protein ERO13_A06G086650v2 [Gossypium hirsutum]